jgi:hypothetical protein
MTTQTPAELKPVRVEAISASWCVAGKVVTPGERYFLPPADASRLVAAGKAILT